jgi:hypothetical protein
VCERFLSFGVVVVSLSPAPPPLLLALRPSLPTAREKEESESTHLHGELGILVALEEARVEEEPAPDEEGRDGPDADGGVEQGHCVFFPLSLSERESGRRAARARTSERASERLRATEAREREAIKRAWRFRRTAAFCGWACGPLDRSRHGRLEGFGRDASARPRAGAFPLSWELQWRESKKQTFASFCFCVRLERSEAGALCLYVLRRMRRCVCVFERDGGVVVAARGLVPAFSPGRPATVAVSAFAVRRRQETPSRAPCRPLQLLSPAIHGPHTRPTNPSIVHHQAIGN